MNHRSVIAAGLVCTTLALGRPIAAHAEEVRFPAPAAPLIPAENMPAGPDPEPLAPWSPLAAAGPAEPASWLGLGTLTKPSVLFLSEPRLSHPAMRDIRLSSGAKTAIIVTAIIVGALLIIGVVAIGRPHKL
jgi:hypothetical protein